MAATVGGVTRARMPAGLTHAALARRDVTAPQLLVFSPSAGGRGLGTGSLLGTRPTFSRMATAERSRLSVYMCRPGAPPSSSRWHIRVPRLMP